MNLDPIILKGLTLLRSRSKESAQQLKSLLDELIAKSKSTEVKINRETDALDNIEKLKRDLIDLGNSHSVKKPKIEIEKVIIKEEHYVERILEVTALKNESDLFLYDIFGDIKDVEDSKNLDIPLELDLSIKCVVCKKAHSDVTNQLIECQDCHSFYHQECHTPIVLDDANDPRFVWYCKSCLSREDDSKTPTYSLISSKEDDILNQFASKDKKISDDSPVLIYHSKNSSESSSKSNDIDIIKQIKKKHSLSSTHANAFKNLKIPLINNTTSTKSPISVFTSSSSTKPKLTGLAGLAANIMQQSSGVSPTSSIPKFGGHKGISSQRSLSLTSANLVNKSSNNTVSFNANLTSSLSSTNMSLKKLTTTIKLPASSNSGFIPPTMKDFEKRLQKMKKKKNFFG
ncbi:unnamed protein product [Gordionus sp. m RMFG-2023]|uniref:integrator complex subunit 12-like n=1 Tax=Gordionus sp. m RMFG-2023 TaxID=3053472 RepID=UPI0030DE3A78